MQHVTNLRVGRVGYRELLWPGETDITGVDFKSIVTIGFGEVSVYNDDDRVPKPPVGTKLNRPAIVTLERIFSPEGIASSRYENQLQQSLTDVGASQLFYSASEGLWSFKCLTSPTMASVELIQMRSSEMKQ